MESVKPLRRQQEEPRRGEERERERDAAALGVRQLRAAEAEFIVQPVNYESGERYAAERPQQGGGAFKRVHRERIGKQVGPPAPCGLGQKRFGEQRRGHQRRPRRVRREAAEPRAQDRFFQNRRDSARSGKTQRERRNEQVDDEIRRKHDDPRLREKPQQPQRKYEIIKLRSAPRRPRLLRVFCGYYSN